MSENVKMLTWVDEPPKSQRGGRSDAHRLANELRKRSGSWAQIRAGASGGSYATNINQGNGPWGPKGEFEACSRINGGKYDIYARHVGNAA